MQTNAARLVAPACAKGPRRALALDSLTRPRLEIPVDYIDLREPAEFEPEPPTAPVSKRELEQSRRAADLEARVRRDEDRPPSGSMELLEGDFVEIDIDPEDLGDTCDRAPAAAPEEPRPVVIDPAKARYVVTAGPNPGEIVLRPLRPGEPPPPDAPIAKLAPSCNYDAYRVTKLLNRR